MKARRVVFLPGSDDCEVARNRHGVAKVVVGKEASGSYTRFGSPEEALAEYPDARQCGRCYRLPRPATISCSLSTDNEPSVEWRPDGEKAFLAWCNLQLDLHSKLPDPRAKLRGLIRQNLRELKSQKGKVLRATHRSASLLDRSDVENVLFTNVDATRSIFRKAASEGVIFEWVPADLSGARAQRCSVYELTEPTVEMAAWNLGKTVAEWEITALPSLAGATGCPPLWFELRSSPAFRVHPVVEYPVWYSAQAMLYGSLDLELALKLKVVLDGMVLALCSENGNSATTGISAFAHSCGRPESQVHKLMMDSSCNRLGTRKMVNAKGLAQPPDSGCVHGSVMVVRDNSPDWRFSGKVVALTRRE